MENTENTQTEDLTIAPEEVNNDYQELLEGKNFFELPYSERVELKKAVREKLSETGKEAVDIGWTPKEMFRGKYKDGSDKPWEDAETFLKRVKEEAPVRNERMRTLANEKDSYKAEMEKMRKQLDAVLEINRNQMEQGLLKEENLTKKELAEAKEMSDVDAYEVAIAKQRELEEQRNKLKTFEEPPLPPKSPDVASEVQEWAAKNDWIVKDPPLLSYAQARDQELELKHPHLSMSERFEMVTNEVRNAFPLKDPTPRQTHKSASNSGSFGSKPKTKSFNDLPKIEKDQARIFIKKGVWKNEADFMKTYKD